MNHNLATLATQWITANETTASRLDPQWYCQTRDVFDVRLDAMTRDILQDHNTIDDHVYLIKAIVGEMGNNAFDHNIGNWPDMPGIFFGYDLVDKKIVLADRGRGVLATLQPVKPGLATDVDALKTAFTERLSSRIPERRGNGLKFVRESIADLRIHLTFSSGSATAELNKAMRIDTTTKNVRGCLAILEFSDTVPA